MSQTQTNYKTLSGTSVIDGKKSVDSDRFMEYRRLWQDAPVQEFVTKFPLNIDVEVTNACNLRCPHCARTHDNWGKSQVGFMDMEIAKKIIQEANQEGAGGIKFSLRGEPLLHPEIANLIKLVDSTRILDYYFNTNAVRLTKELAEQFVNCKLPRISISVGGGGQTKF